MLFEMCLSGCWPTVWQSICHSLVLNENWRTSNHLAIGAREATAHTQMPEFSKEYSQQPAQLAPE